MDIEKYLKVIEAEKNRPEEKHIVHIKSLDEDMEIRTLTHSERRDLIYSQRIKKVTIGDMLTPEMIKTIYSCMDLKKIAVPAKEKGLIQSYYDIIEYQSHGCRWPECPPHLPPTARMPSMTEMQN